MIAKGQCILDREGEENLQTDVADPKCHISSNQGWCMPKMFEKLAECGANMEMSF